jgi:plasmid stabilization system protein ParE
MNTFDLFLSPFALEEMNAIYEGIIEFSDEASAFAWEDILYQQLESLRITPYQQEQERETKLAKTPIRRFLSVQKSPRREYHVYYVIHPKQNTPPQNGEVRIISVRHASQKPLTTKELKIRLENLEKAIAQIEASRAEAEEEMRG